MSLIRTTGARRGAVAAVAAAVLALAAVPLAVVAVGAGAGFVPAGPDAAVAPADAGVNRFDVVEPGTVVESPKADPADRALLDWVPTAKKPPRPSPVG